MGALLGMNRMHLNSTSPSALKWEYANGLSVVCRPARKHIFDASCHAIHLCSIYMQGAWCAICCHHVADMVLTVLTTMSSSFAVGICKEHCRLSPCQHSLLPWYLLACRIAFHWEHTRACLPFAKAATWKLPLPAAGIACVYDELCVLSHIIRH